MSAVAPTRTDRTLQTAILAELEWTPEVDASGISVNVLNSVVTLSGEVGDYPELFAAKRAARRVRGVSTIVEDLLVDPASGATVTEADIAREATHALAWKITVPDSVRAEVDGHSVTLAGEVGWNFQRVAAKRAVQYLPGIHSVDNQISLTARASDEAAEERIKNALLRNARVDVEHLEVTVTGTVATLTGHVQSLAEKHQAGMATWSSPYVTEIDNRLEIRSSPSTHSGEAS
ncbi:BON domain-containing protein [Nesterenkonia lutea]|uniref:Osmotically-inducible protein OsmY n=1 Tax=Nesterenkonia lutea TaxID=272919 RepID=A0ABR9JGC2_9MICC|nr:BON domain-containing protein [Nesterenkonia lutea]MBE1524980.1 osmotically-inducible protein OsmY [Nesterenkonia lutea]